jgi:hypothetical protein
VVDEFRLDSGSVWLERDKRDDSLATIVVRGPDYGRLAYARVFVESILNFARPHFVSRGDDDIFLAVHQI